MEAAPRHSQTQKILLLGRYRSSRSSTTYYHLELVSKTTEVVEVCTHDMASLNPEAPCSEPTPAVPVLELFSLEGQNVLITGATRGASLVFSHLGFRAVMLWLASRPIFAHLTDG